MIPRVLLAGALVALAGCQWSGRPDGASANHTPGDGTYEDNGAVQPTLMPDNEVVEPLGAAPPPQPAPVDLTQPPPTTGTTDSVSAVQEALTPGN